jgi:hypothetical protein
MFVDEPKYSGTGSSRRDPSQLMLRRDGGQARLGSGVVGVELKYLQVGISGSARHFKVAVSIREDQLKRNRIGVFTVQFLHLSQRLVIVYHSRRHLRGDRSALWIAESGVYGRKLLVGARSILINL